VEKLRGLGNTRGQILEFPIEMAGHLYNRAGATAQPVIQRLIDQKSQILPTPFSLSALVRGDLLRIYEKALRFLKLESSGQSTLKIW